MKIKIDIDEQQTIILNLDNSPLKENENVSIEELENFVDYLHTRINVLKKLKTIDNTTRKRSYNRKSVIISNQRRSFTDKEKLELLKKYNTASKLEREKMMKEYNFKNTTALSQFMYLIRKRMTRLK